MRGSISALKPGPVVPPGTQKVPNQAARNSQSAVFGHLSDILAFFRGGHFFHYFLTFFTFHFCHFFTFCIFHFCHFFTFSVFLIFDDFLIFVIFLDFAFFHCFFLFFNFVKGILKIRPSFDPFCPPSSTPMASTLGGSIPYVKFEHCFFVTFHDFDSFLVIFDHFFMIFQFCH